MPKEGYLLSIETGKMTQSNWHKVEYLILQG